MTERIDDDFYPFIEPDESVTSPSIATVGDVLTEADYPQLYQLVRDEGLPYFCRTNATGDVELYLVFESIEGFSEATGEESQIEFKTYQNKLLAVIWTRLDPENPLGFPVLFNIKDSEQRYMALRMLKQATTTLFYLAYENEQVIHIFSEELTFSDTEKQQVEGYIQYLYQDEPDKTVAPGEQEVKEEPTQSISALTLPDDVLREEGIAYLFHYESMVKQHGEEQAQNLLMGTVHQAMLVMRRHARSDVRETSFTVWVAEAATSPSGKQLRVYITPSLFTLFEVVHTSEDESHPFSKFLLALSEFERTEEGSPLAAGAYPIFRFEQGKWYHLELNETVQARLSALYVQTADSAINPYA